LIINNLPHDLADDKRKRAVELILDNVKLFNKHEFDFGRTDLITHSIDNGNCRPIAQPRRHPRAYFDSIDNTVHKMLGAGVFEPDASPWSFNVALVPRPGNPVPRVTKDYRALNAECYKDEFPLSHVSDC